LPTQYQYRCDGCGQTTMVRDRENVPPCPSCGLHVKRIYSFTSTPSMAEHFNHSVGEYVTNRRAFYDALKRKSDESSARTGMDVDLQPLSPADMAEASAHGVTDEGLDATYQAWADS
jgi:predicted nucleic acid-binding Zn ribbon protein